MGIPRFFKWLNDNFSECLFLLKEGETFTNLNIKTDSSCIDLNAIIHPECQRIYKYGKYKEEKSHFLHKQIPTEKMVFNSICKKIEELRMIMLPKKQIIIAIDGVAGLSKITQQRQRRFKSSLERDPSQEFDSNKITTGTEFMFNMSKYINIFIRNKLENEWKDLEIIFSNEKVVGEGEHKIIRHIHINREKYNYTTVSPDADLIMLKMGLVQKNNYILRENIYDDIDAKYFVVDVDKFKSMLIDKINIKYISTENYLMYDLILLFFFFGNDFLPRIPSIDISDKNISQIINNYKFVYSKNGNLVYRNKKNILCINKKNFKNILQNLCLNKDYTQNEDFILYSKSNKKVKYPDSLLKKCISLDEDQQLTFDFDTYHTLYYRNKMEEENVKKVTDEYFKGLLFVLRYYIDGMPDWHWFYPFNYSPFFCDMYNNIDSFDFEYNFEIHEPLNLFEQLLSVLPSSSSEILPCCCKPLITETNSEIIEFYPKNFKIDLEGKNQDWEGHPILPFINVEKLKNAYIKVSENLTEKELERIKVGKTIKYFKLDNNLKIISYN